MMRLLFLSFFALFLFACTTESPFESVQEDIEDEISWDIDRDVELYKSSSSYQSESEKCRLGTSAYSDSWCCYNYGYQCYTYSSSSSYQSESEKCRLGTSAYSDSYCCSTYGYQCKSYLESSKSMKFCLTYFETENNWDGLGVGDPEISFTIYAITSAGQSTTIYTGKLLDKDNTKFWSGNSCTTKTIPALIQTIKVCPTVIDEDVSSDGDDNYSSRMCYSVSSIGYLKDYDEQEQSDYWNSDCTVKWEWYLY